MRNPKLLAAAALIGGLALSTSAWAPKGGNTKGKDGGSVLRLCANFTPKTEPYINDDSRGHYCDGIDGEIFADKVLKLSTTTSNRKDRRVSVKFQGSSCYSQRTDDPPFSGKTVDRNGSVDGLNAFFGWQASEYTGCSPGDPFSALFDPNSLECLSDSHERLALTSIPEHEVRYMSWRIDLGDPSLGAKKGGEALLMVFGGALGPNVCPQGDGDSGTNDGGLPVAVKCTAVDADSKCNGWHVRGFRACVYDYDTAKGGNWRWGGDGCPANTEIEFTVP